MKKALLTGLILAVAFQFFILTGMVVTSALPLVTGKEVRVRTLPVDPRSLFRGNYARLGYEFSSIPEDRSPAGAKIRTGEVVYALLKSDPAQSGEPVYRFDRVVLERPEKGVFLRGRAVNNYGTIRVRYGIEAFFAPKDKAIELEKKLRNEAVAVLMIAPNGRARIQEVISK